MNDISNRDDTIDSSEVEERIDDIEDEQDSLIEDFESAIEALDEARQGIEDAEPIDQHNGVDPSGELSDAIERAATALIAFWNMEGDASEGENVVGHAQRLLEAFRDPADAFLGDEELHALKAFRDELEPYCDDWRHGTTLVRDSYWTEYVQGMLEDIGDLPRDLPGYIVIDWERTADNVREDYTSGDFDGVTYWAR